MASSVSGFSLKLSHKKPTFSSSISSFQNPSVVPCPFADGTSRFLPQQVAREIPPTTLSNSSGHDVVLSPKWAIQKKPRLEKEPRELWKMYVDWLYQHKELGLYLDVSRVGFTDEFFQEIEPRLQKTFKDMEELERGSIANPDEGRMRVAETPNTVKLTDRMWARLLTSTNQPNFLRNPEVLLDGVNKQVIDEINNLKITSS